jgi:hypothetical protein
LSVVLKFVFFRNRSHDQNLEGEYTKWFDDISSAIKNDLDGIAARSVIATTPPVPPADNRWTAEHISVSINCEMSVYSPLVPSRILMLVDRLDSTWKMSQEKSTGYPGSVSVDGRPDSVLCRVTNDSESRLIDVELELRGRHQKVTPVETGGFTHESMPEYPERGWPFSITSLDPGRDGSFDLQIQNHSTKHSVVFYPLKDVRFSLVGRKGRFKVSPRVSGESFFMLDRTR